MQKLLILHPSNSEKQQIYIEKNYKTINQRIPLTFPWPN